MVTSTVGIPLSLILEATTVPSESFTSLVPIDTEHRGRSGSEFVGRAIERGHGVSVGDTGL
jgi:hypothetical protein